jgi:hypothetical protein
MSVTLTADDIKVSKSKEIMLYYKIDEENSVDLTFLPYIPSSSTYSGIQNRRMTDSNYEYNNDIIAFIGYRTPANELLKIPKLYNEWVQIMFEDGNFISANALYVDAGTSFTTIKPSQKYQILSKSNKYIYYNTLEIIFDNVLHRRVIILS